MLRERLREVKGEFKGRYGTNKGYGRLREAKRKNLSMRCPKL
jgi:hypothetical protein